MSTNKKISIKYQPINIITGIQTAELDIPILVNLSIRSITLRYVLVHSLSIFNSTNINHGQSYPIFIAVLHLLHMVYTQHDGSLIILSISSIKKSGYKAFAKFRGLVNRVLMIDKDTVLLVM